MDIDEKISYVFYELKKFKSLEHERLPSDTRRITSLLEDLLEDINKQYKDSDSFYIKPEFKKVKVDIDGNCVYLTDSTSESDVIYYAAGIWHNSYVIELSGRTIHIKKFDSATPHLGVYDYDSDGHPNSILCDLPVEKSDFNKTLGAFTDAESVINSMNILKTAYTSDEIQSYINRVLPETTKVFNKYNPLEKIIMFGLFPEIIQLKKDFDKFKSKTLK